MHEKIDFRYGHFGGGWYIIKSAPFLLVFLFCGDLIIPKVRCYFHVNAPIYSIILLENQVFIPDLLVGKLSYIIFGFFGNCPIQRICYIFFVYSYSFRFFAHFKIYLHKKYAKNAFLFLCNLSIFVLGIFVLYSFVLSSFSLPCYNTLVS